MDQFRFETELLGVWQLVRCNTAPVVVNVRTTSDSVYYLINAIARRAAQKKQGSRSAMLYLKLVRKVDVNSFPIVVKQWNHINGQALTVARRTCCLARG